MTFLDSKLKFTFILFVSFHLGYTQTVGLTQIWPAHWIMASDGSAKDYGVHFLRKTFELAEVPDSLMVHTSGDNRYQLFVNDQLVTWGPLRGDLRHWYFESTDIAPYLKTGKNVIAANVLNYGANPPDAQLTIQTGFILAAGDKKFSFINSNDCWKALGSKAYSPNVIDRDQVRGYYGGGSREIMDGNQYPWGWSSLNFDDTEWLPAQQIETGKAKTCIWAGRWKLTPRHLPMEKLEPIRFARVALKDNLDIPEEFPGQAADIIIPANTKARFVLDNATETTAFPVLKLSQGKNATIKMTYVEAPYIGNPSDRNKGNRNEVEGKTFFGYFDHFTADGGTNRIYSPLHWRAYRYIEVVVETAAQPLTIHDMSGIYSTYPFDLKARIEINGKAASGEIDYNRIADVLDIGERTVRLCSHETFMDCPYYEESQFEGDTRIQALISYYNFGDPALGKNAIEQFEWSLNEEGFLSARYPTNSYYYIPNYSLFWIGMLYDYMMHYNDRPFVADKLQSMRTILQYFIGLQREDGTLRRPDYHNFVDWSLPRGEAPFSEDGYSALVDLHFLLALQWAQALEDYAGEVYFAIKYQQKIAQLKEVIPELYYNSDLNLYQDIPGEPVLSQHTNCMVIITGLAKGGKAKSIMREVLQNQEMTQATLYWQFYLNQALQKSGLGDEYLKNLTTWNKFIDLGVTTWPETTANSRSECHGWGASPNYHLYTITAGINSDAPGFDKIRITPHFGNANSIQATMPHHAGMIELHASKDKKGNVDAEVTLPAGTSGVFVWQGKEVALKAGKQKIEL